MVERSARKFRPVSLGVALLFVGVVYGYLVIPALREIWPAVQRSRAETFRSRQRLGRTMAGPREQPRIWMFTAEGPELLDGYGLSRELQPQQRQIVNAILKVAYREYLELEAQHSMRRIDEGHQITSIESFAAPFEEFEQRLWTKLDQVFDEQQQARAREGLPTRRNGSQSSLFGWGGEAATVDIWREGENYHWIVTIAGESANRSGPAIPQELARFWEAMP